jgi:hypothetical protein
VIREQIIVGRSWVLDRLSAPPADDPDDRADGPLSALDLESSAAFLMLGKEGRETPPAELFHPRLCH